MSAAGNFCGTATGILASHPFTREDHALIGSFIPCPPCPYTASEHGRGMGRSGARQTDGNRAKEAAGRAESCSLCSPLGTRRERPAGCWAGEREDLRIGAGTGLRVNENWLVGEKEVREEARWPGLCCWAGRSRAIHILLRSGAPHLRPARHTVPHPSLQAKMLLGSFTDNFNDCRMTCMFPVGNHRKGIRGLRALR